MADRWQKITKNSANIPGSFNGNREAGAIYYTRASTALVRSDNSAPVDDAPRAAGIVTNRSLCAVPPVCTPDKRSNRADSPRWQAVNLQLPFYWQ